jgi:ankyrin repeat protein
MLILWAVWLGHEEVIKLLLENSAKSESRNFFNLIPLSLVIVNGNLAIIKLLLESGINPDSNDNNDYMPLSYVTEDGHEAIVRLLLETNRIHANTKDACG